MNQLNQPQTPFQTIITSLKLQRSQLEGQLYQLKEKIDKKQQSIATVETYSSEYKGTIYTADVHRVPTYRNSQLFLDKLADVLYSEKQELTRLERQQMELLKHYHTLNQKIDGLTDMLTIKNKARLAAIDNIEDVIRTELATLRACRQTMENNQ